MAVFRWFPATGLVAGGLVVLGCGFDWDPFDPRLATVTDGGMGAGGAGGGGAGGAPCADPSPGGAPSAKFGEPTVVAELVEGGVDASSPAFTGDLLELYFTSSRADDGISHVFRSERSCPGDPWSAPLEVGELSSMEAARSVVVSPNGLWLAVAYEGATPNLVEISTTSRSTRGDAWAAPVLQPELNTTVVDRPNWISDDGLRIGLDSEVAGAGDLFEAERAAVVDKWPVPAPLAELNTSTPERKAWSSPDALTLYFAADMASDENIFRSSRAAPDNAWGPSEPLAELNTSDAEGDPWLSPDGRLLLFTRTVAGRVAIYQAWR